VVLDTNVVISALLSPHRAAAQVLDLVIAGDLTALLDDRIVSEYRAVAHRPRFGLPAADVDRVLDAIVALAEHVTARPLDVTLPDADDLPFLEVAAAGRADLLVTGNARHFIPMRGTHDVTVASPRELLDALRGVG
jgi:putative PIN family toxin of toxin-antitoxin system